MCKNPWHIEVNGVKKMHYATHLEALEAKIELQKAFNSIGYFDDIIEITHDPNYDLIVEMKKIGVL